MNTLPAVATLNALTTDQLKMLIAELAGRTPKMNGREFLMMAAAWHLQAREHGGIPASTRRKLASLAQAIQEGRKPSIMAPTARFRPGTSLIKEWRGITYTVTVRDDGFEFNGRPYRSLSEIAREITGTRWNGPAFFGMRRPAQAQTAEARP